MRKFYVTFGQRYSYEEHPQGGHPSGWFTFYADNEEQARKMAFKFLDNKWAFMYEANDFNKRLYPLGELKEIR